MCSCVCMEPVVLERWQSATLAKWCVDLISHSLWDMECSIAVSFCVSVCFRHSLLFASPTRVRMPVAWMFVPTIRMPHTVAIPWNVVPYHWHYHPLILGCLVFAFVLREHCAMCANSKQWHSAAVLSPRATLGLEFSLADGYFALAIRGWTFVDIVAVAWHIDDGAPAWIFIISRDFLWKDLSIWATNCVYFNSMIFLYFRIF